MFFPWNHQIWMWICYIWECCLGFESHLNHLDYWQDWLLMHVELGLRSWGGSGGRLKGLARTQIPTNRNYAVEFHTFGEIAGVNHSQVQWSSLALGKPPCWSWLIPRPGKYAFKASLGKRLRTTKLTLLLSPAPSRSPLCQDGQYLTPIFHPWWTSEKLKAREIQKIHTPVHTLAVRDWKNDSLLQVRHL